MMIRVPAMRSIYAGHYGSGVKEVVQPGNMPMVSGNGFGMNGWVGDTWVPGPGDTVYGNRPTFIDWRGNAIPTAYAASYQPTAPPSRFFDYTWGPDSFAAPYMPYQRDPNDTGMDGLEGWFDGVDWGSIIETGAKAGATIATNQFGQPNLKPGQSIQRVRNPDGSYSEVLTQQTPGVPIGFNTTTAGAAAAGVGVGTLAVIGVGLVAVFMLQGRR